MLLNLRCRTCLCQKTETIPLENSISIEEYNINIPLIDIIKECASVEIPLEDSKPHSICTTCVHNAKISYTFRRKCKQSQLSLAEESIKTNEIKVEDDEDVFTSDDDIPLSAHVQSADPYKNASNNIKIEVQLDDAPNSQHHVCSVCSKSFSIRKYYLMHMQRHAETSFRKMIFRKTEETDQNISDTELIVKYELDYSTSSSLEHSKKTRPCKKCPAEFDSHREWKDHLKTHSYKSKKSKKRSCPECFTTFTSPSQWVSHVRTAHKTYTCRQCNITPLHTIRQLKTHMTRMHSGAIYTNPSTKPVTCDICGKAYVRRESMFKHKRRKHGSEKLEKETQVDEQGISHCDYCQWKGTYTELPKHKMAEHSHMRSIACVVCKKMFFNIHNLRVHMLVHTGEKKHMCEVCGCSFALKSNLLIHKRVHTGEKPYKCDQCDKSFTQHSSLHVHKFTHTEKPTFSCDQCGATFYRKDSFRYHVKKHRSIDEWDKCEICDKKFKSRKLLKNHMVVHTGERNHQCSVCDKSFGRRSSLRTHMNIHTGEKRHICLICGRAFLQKHVLVTHMKTHGNK